jgi:hypothetical protein
MASLSLSPPDDRWACEPRWRTCVLPMPFALCNGVANAAALLLRCQVLHHPAKVDNSRAQLVDGGVPIFHARRQSGNSCGNFWLSALAWIFCSICSHTSARVNSPGAHRCWRTIYQSCQIVFSPKKQSSRISQAIGSLSRGFCGPAGPWDRGCGTKCSIAPPGVGVQIDVRQPHVPERSRPAEAAPAGPMSLPQGQHPEEEMPCWSPRFT